MSHPNRDLLGGDVNVLEQSGYMPCERIKAEGQENNRSPAPRALKVSDRLQREGGLTDEVAIGEELHTVGATL